LDLGYDVAEKMGALDELRQHDLKVQEFRIVDRAGRRISGFNQGEIQKLLKGRGMSLPRSALASALYEAVKDRVDVRFGESVASPSVVGTWIGSSRTALATLSAFPLAISSTAGRMTLSQRIRVIRAGPTTRRTPAGAAIRSTTSTPMMEQHRESANHGLSKLSSA
jgi:hypothetical protein